MRRRPELETCPPRSLSEAPGGLAAARLLVVDGVDRGRELRIAPGGACIGSRLGCDLRLKDRTVSREHARVEVLANGLLRVEDLGSTNGTLYLGARVSKVDIPAGATLELGSTRLAVLPERREAVSPSARLELGGLDGRSLAMRRLYAELERAAPSEAPVLIAGETGVGKERVARALHALSPRAAGPFRVFDCAAVQRELVQSALFGHARGAFTGADKERRGALEEAHGGTLFLDEVGELPLDLQPAFLRALESGQFVRVGETEPRTADFRIVCATHQNLAQAVEERRFHRGLYYRLAALVLQVPSLRQRREDIPLLARRFATELGGEEDSLPPAVVSELCARNWPGNVRELRNAVMRAVRLGSEGVEREVSQTELVELGYHQAREAALHAFERSYLETLLGRHRGSLSAAAREAGVARSTLYELMKTHGLTAAYRRGPRDAD